MPAAFPFSNTKVSASSTKERAYRTKEAKFGNGYGQSISDGINDVMDTWSLTLELLTQAERDQMVTVLETVKNWDYITWTAPGDSAQKRWKLKGSFRESMDGLYYTMTFTLEQTY